MTERDWLNATEPAPMIDWLTTRVPLGQLPNARNRREASAGVPHKLWLWAETCRNIAHPEGAKWGDSGIGLRAFVNSWSGGPTLATRNSDEACPMPLRAALLREIVGNPFRPLKRGWPNPDAACCSVCEPGDCPWLTPNVRGIAGRIDAEQAWDAMPILRDALLDAGCENEDVLRHLEGKERCPKCGGTRFFREWVHEPDPPHMRRMIPKMVEKEHPCWHCNFTGWIPLRTGHVPGCWVIDLLTGRA